MRDLERHTDRRAVIEGIFEAMPSRIQASKLTRDLGCGRCLQLRHSHLNDLLARLFNQCREQVVPRPVRGDHRFEIRDVVIWSPRRMRPRPEHLTNTRLFETVTRNKRKGLDQNALFRERRRIRRHRPRRLAAHIGVVPATANKEARSILPADKDGRHDRHVRQDASRLQRDRS